jgi:hypothetical protein
MGATLQGSELGPQLGNSSHLRVYGMSITLNMNPKNQISWIPVISEIFELSTTQLLFQWKALVEIS